MKKLLTILAAAMTLTACNGVKTTEINRMRRCRERSYRSNDEP